MPLSTRSVAAGRESAPWAVAVAAGSLALAGAIVLGADGLGTVPVTWVLLAALTVPCVAVLVVFARRGRLVEPLPVVAGVVLTAFAGRALQLVRGVDELRSFRPSSGDLSTGFDLRSQEIALYMTRKLTVPPETALARALAALTLFAVAVGIAYRSAPGRRLAERAARLGAATDRLDLRFAVAALLGCGLLAHAVVYALIGGPVAALQNILGQSNLAVPFALLVAAGFPTVAVLLWYVWHPPGSRATRMAFVLAVAESVVFWATTGSRTHAFAPLFVLFIARHHVRRPWTAPQVAAIVLALTLTASTLLVIRQGTYSQSLGRAVAAVPQYALDPSATLFDNTTFDDFTAAVNLYGVTVPHGHGAAVTDAVRSFVPRRFDPDRPQGGDIEFRRLVLGDSYQGGRPYSVVGELYRDLGWAGIALGGLALGLLVRGLAGLAAGERPAPGRRLRIVLLALGLLILYGLLVGTYSIALGDLVEIGIPLALALIVLARPVAARA